MEAGCTERQEEAIRHIDERGFYIWENALESSFCNEILSEIDSLERLCTPRSLDNDFHGHKTTRYYDVLNYGDIWQHVVTHPNILSVAQGVLGKDCLLNTFGTSIINPGETAQPMHVDDGPFIAAHNSALRDRPRLGNAAAQWRLGGPNFRNYWRVSIAETAVFNHAGNWTKRSSPSRRSR